MKIILSPAKNMKQADDDFQLRSLPAYLDKTQILLDRMRELSSGQLKKMWNCSDKIAAVNEERIRRMDLKTALSPAVFTYVGLAFQHMAPGAMTQDQLEYLQEHLCILSGFYGVLRPFDGVVPYRLEMQSVVPGTGDLYSFWGSDIHDGVSDGGPIINLASKEYSQCVQKYLKPDEKMISITFGELKNSKVITKGTMAKMARGEMTWWLAENRTEDPQEIKSYSNGYRYCDELSSDCEYVFLSAKENI